MAFIPCGGDIRQTIIAYHGGVPVRGFHPTSLMPRNILPQNPNICHNKLQKNKKTRADNLRPHNMCVSGKLIKLPDTLFICKYHITRFIGCFAVFIRYAKLYRNSDCVCYVTLTNNAAFCDFGFNLA